MNILQIIQRQFSIFHQLNNYHRAVFLSFTLPVIKLPNRSSNILYVGLIDVESRWMVEKIILCIISWLNAQNQLKFILKESQTQNYQFVADNGAESSQLITAWASTNRRWLSWMNHAVSSPVDLPLFMMQFHLVSFLYRQTFELHQLRNKHDLEEKIIHLSN